MAFHSNLIAELEKYGVVMCSDDQLAQRFREYIADSPCSVEFMAEHGLSLVFFFNQSEQPEELTKFDGLCFKFDHSNGGPVVYAIGLSVKAIERGREYANETWLHECAHVLHGLDHQAHDSRFREILRALQKAAAI